MLTVVLYAVVLFFAGMTTRLGSTRLRWVMTVSGCLVLAGALIWIATGTALGAFMPAIGVAVIAAFIPFYWLPISSEIPRRERS